MHSARPCRKCTRTAANRRVEREFAPSDGATDAGVARALSIAPTRSRTCTARACEAFGQRVQYSVFECDVSETDLVRLRQRLLKIVDEDRDSLRIYRLRGKREEIVESYGRDTYVDFWGPLVV